MIEEMINFVSENVDVLTDITRYMSFEDNEDLIRKKHELNVSSLYQHTSDNV